MFEYIWILLPLGLIIGWYAAKLDSSRKRKLHQYLNLRYYLEKEQDKPDPITEQMIPLNVEDEGIHFTLTLGDAYRRRGEVDRAIELHEHLLHDTGTNDHNRPRVLMSLAEDYIVAGIFDRSEQTLRDLLSTKQHDFAALKLASLYKQQNDWLQAASMYERISGYKERYSIEVSHLYCELAEQLLSHQDFKGAEFWVDQALSIAPDIARVSLIKAYIAFNQKKYQEVIEQLTFLEDQQASLMTLVVPVMYRAMMNVNNAQFQPWLEGVIVNHPQYFYLKIWKAHWLAMSQSVDEAIAYLTKMLQLDKNLQGITLLNQLYVLQKDQYEEVFNLYHQTFYQVIDYYAQFRCERCGFIAKTLQWHCPSCLSWNTAAPVSDIIALQK